MSGAWNTWNEFVRNYPFVVFPLIWAAVLFAASRFGGWSRLAETYGRAGSLAAPLVRFQSASVGRGSFSNALNFDVASEGLGIQPILLFRFFHPLLVIPWNELRVRRKKRWLWESVELIPERANHITITISQSLAKKLADAAGDQWPETRDEQLYGHVLTG